MKTKIDQLKIWTKWNPETVYQFLGIDGVFDILCDLNSVIAERDRLNDAIDGATQRLIDVLAERNAAIRALEQIESCQEGKQEMRKIARRVLDEETNRRTPPTPPPNRLIREDDTAGGRTLGKVK